MPLDRNQLIAYAFFACAFFFAHTSIASTPYWEDPTWQERLNDSIKLSVRYSEDGDAVGFAPATATLEFDCKDGKLENISIVKSTGSEYLDKIVMDGVAKAAPPPIDQQQNLVPHHFQTTLDVEPNDNQFRSYINEKLAEKIHLPNDKYTDKPIMVFADEDYYDGKFINIKMSGADGSEDLQPIVAGLLDTFPLPAPTAHLKDKKIHFELNMCVSRTFQACMHDVSGRRSSRGLYFVVTP